MNHRWRGLAVLAVFASLPALAWPPFAPLRDIGGVPQPAKPETVRQVRTANVVWANYPLIRRDFPSLAPLGDDEIDAWLVRQAVVSRAQAEQTEFNTSIQTGDYEGKAVRPKDYGRGLVVDTGAGLIDVKGAGSDNPRYDWEDGDPRNGNVTLGEAMREDLMSELVEDVVRDAELDVKVVRNYAVIDTGFDVIHRNSARQEVGRSPAGMLFRQAHTRFEDPQAAHVADRGKYYLWNQAKSLTVEKVLRRYGLSSEGSGRAPGAAEGGVNIQGTMDGAILDFGNYVARDRFEERPVYHFYGTEPLLAPGPGFLQPDPRLLVPMAQWGAFRAGHIDSKADRPWVYSHEAAKYIAERFRRGDKAAAREAAANHRRNMLGPVKAAFRRRAQLGCKRALDIVLP